MHDLLDWDDARYLLAVLRAGSFTLAAQRLGVEQSTVSRRIARLEAGLNAQLFERTPAGLRQTALARQLAPHAEQIEASLIAMQDVASRGGQIEGVVRLATTDSVAAYLLAPALIALAEAHPKLSLEVLTDPRLVDLRRREAELAVRFMRPTRGALVSRKLGELHTAPLASASYWASLPEGAPLSQARWIVVSVPGLPQPEEAWFEARGWQIEPMRVSSYIAQSELVRRGVGVGMLAQSLCRIDPSLSPHPREPIAGPTLSLWLAAHADALRLPRVRATWDMLASSIPAQLTPLEQDEALPLGASQ